MPNYEYVVCFLAKDFGISKLHAPCDVNQTIDIAITKYLITFATLVETLYDYSILIIGYLILPPTFSSI